MIRPLLAIALLSSAVTAWPCTCVTQQKLTAKTLMANDAVVFRGVVVERKRLPLRREMRGRDRYAITFRVGEFWKGSPGRSLTLYGLDPGTDCLGDGGYEVGKEYLVYAREERATDVVLDDLFWYGWKDLFREGTSILVPDDACKPVGEVAKVRATLDELGAGKTPAAEPKR